MNSLKQMPEWLALEKHFQEIKNVHLKDLFKNNNRGKKFFIEHEDLYFDFSKNRITEETLSLLLNMAKKAGLKNAIEDMFTGKKINKTENRAVLHTALRNFTDDEIIVDGENIIPLVKTELKKMEKIAESIRKGNWKGASGKKIKNIVNIGIGGSDLGPNMVTEALKFYSDRSLNVSFVSNVDENHIIEVTRSLDPEETLFIIASKTFTTQETMTNAESAKKWILNCFNDNSSIAKHFIALSTNVDAVLEFGIDRENILQFWDWVGGRYSLTSAIGLSIMISIGAENFTQLLKGFHSMDLHFRNSEFENNIPVVMALIGIWYNNFFGFETYAVLPYNQYLHRFSAYLQQCDMESNGKYVNKDGVVVDYQTGPIVWGEAGTNGQHAFYQLIHQGTKVIPTDFIGFVKSLYNESDHHNKLMANFFAQPEALAFGKDRSLLEKEDVSEELIPYKIFEGNRPSNSILIKELDPYNLGSLIALYEHKIFVQGVLWDIFSFDQWGVELGKVLAKKILPELENGQVQSELHDSSTGQLIQYYINNS